MQKVVGSSPIIRSPESPVPDGALPFLAGSPPPSIAALSHNPWLRVRTITIDPTPKRGSSGDDSDVAGRRRVAGDRRSGGSRRPAPRVAQQSRCGGEHRAACWRHGGRRAGFASMSATTLWTLTPRSRPASPATRSRRSSPRWQTSGCSSRASTAPSSAPTSRPGSEKPASRPSSSAVWSPTTASRRRRAWPATWGSTRGSSRTPPPPGTAPDPTAPTSPPPTSTP